MLLLLLRLLCLLLLVDHVVLVVVDVLGFELVIDFLLAPVAARTASFANSFGSYCCFLFGPVVVVVVEVVVPVVAVAVAVAVVVVED